MTAVCALGDGSNALPFDRELANWQGRIAKGGLGEYQAALSWLKQHVPADSGLCEDAKQELLDAAERHLADTHGLAVIDAIYGAVFPEEVSDDVCDNNKLDACAIKIDDDAEIERLAKLPAIEYDRLRKPTAARLGISLKALDAEVKAARTNNSETKGQGRPIEFTQVEPWPTAVDGANLLRELSTTLRKYVIMTGEQADAISLWNIHTYTQDASDVSPKLVLKSAQKRSGKTRLAAVLARTVARPLYVSGITPAALLRIIETQHPTLLLDEMDAAMKQDREMAEALRGIINSSFDRPGARYIMNVPIPGGGYEPRQFSTWAPQLLSGIGNLPDTVRDRSIEIEMVRKRRCEKVKRLRRRDGDDLCDLSRQSSRWASDNLEKLRNSNPEMPSGLDDRAADAWEPLFAIAYLAGEDWPQRAHKAALALSGEHIKEDDEIGTVLFTDVRAIFDLGSSVVYVTKEDGKQIKSEELVKTLVAIEGHPWAEFGRDRKPITQNRLARLLKPYKIKPGTIRIGSGPKDTAKGYKLAQFTDAFARYLPDLPNQTVTTSQSNNDGRCDDLQTVTPDPDVTLSEPSQPNNDGHCDGVTVRSPPLWEQEL